MSTDGNNAVDPIHYIPVSAAAVLSVAFDRECRLFAAGDAEGCVLVYDLRSWNRVQEINPEVGAVSWLHFANCGRLIVQGRNGQVKIFCLQPPSGVAEAEAAEIRTDHRGFCKGDALGNTLAMPCREGGITIRRITAATENKNGLQLQTICTSETSSSSGNIMALKLASSDRLLAAYEDKSVIMWKVENKKQPTEVGRLDLPGNLIPTGLDFDASTCKGIAIGASSNLISFSADEESMALIGDRDTPAEGASSAAIRSLGDPKVAAVASWDSTIRLFSWKRPEKLKPLGALKFHSGNVEAVAWSPEKVKLKGRSQRLLAAGGKDGKVSFWDVYNE